jgi:hypothetical protein
MGEHKIEEQNWVKHSTINNEQTTLNRGWGNLGPQFCIKEKDMLKPCAKPLLRKAIIEALYWEALACLLHIWHVMTKLSLGGD